MVDMSNFNWIVANDQALNGNNFHYFNNFYTYQGK